MRTQIIKEKAFISDYKDDKRWTPKKIGEIDFIKRIQNNQYMRQV